MYRLEVISSPTDVRHVAGEVAQLLDVHDLTIIEVTETSVVLLAATPVAGVLLDSVNHSRLVIEPFSRPDRPGGSR